MMAVVHTLQQLSPALSDINLFSRLKDFFIYEIVCSKTRQPYEPRSGAVPPPPILNKQQISVSHVNASAESILDFIERQTSSISFFFFCFDQLKLLIITDPQVHKRMDTKSPLCSLYRPDKENYSYLLHMSCLRWCIYHVYVIFNQSHLLVYQLMFYCWEEIPWSQ